MAQKKPDELTEAVGELLRMVHKAADLETINVFVQLDLTITQVRAVFLLAAHDHALPISEVADQLSTSAATAGRTIDRLVTLGIVDRHEDPEDRRTKLVSLTPTGQELADTQREAIQDRIREFIEALPSAEAGALRDALHAALAAVPAHFRADDACAPPTKRN